MCANWLDPVWMGEKIYKGHYLDSRENADVTLGGLYISFPGVTSVLGFVSGHSWLLDNTIIFALGRWVMQKETKKPG